MNNDLFNSQMKMTKKSVHLEGIWMPDASSLIREFKSMKVIGIPQGGLSRSVQFVNKCVCTNFFVLYRLLFAYYILKDGFRSKRIKKTSFLKD